MNTSEFDPQLALKSVVSRLFAEFFNGKHTDVAEDLISPAYTGPAGRGPQGFRALALQLLQGFPDLQFSIEDMVEEGTRVAVRWKSVGTHRGPFAGIAPTGRTVRNEGLGIYRLREGKIVEIISQVDRLGVLQQIGAVPIFAAALPSATAAQTESQPRA